MLKIIACMSMLMDHAGYLIYDGKTSALNLIRKTGFSYFCFPDIPRVYVYKKFEKILFEITYFCSNF